MSDNDAVNSPNHYTKGGIECLVAMEASMTPIEFQGFLKGAVFKYIWRYRDKGNATQDLGKAQYYLKMLAERAEPQVAGIEVSQKKTPEQVIKDFIKVDPNLPEDVFTKRNPGAVPWTNSPGAGKHWYAHTVNVMGGGGQPNIVGTPIFGTDYHG